MEATTISNTLFSKAWTGAPKPTIYHHSQIRHYRLAKLLPYLDNLSVRKRTNDLVAGSDSFKAKKVG